MAKMRVVQVSRPSGPLELLQREIPAPAAGQVRIKVQACGICHSDSLIKEGTFPGLQYPRVPGHEVVGLIDAVGPDVPRWKAGEVSGWDGMVGTAGTAIPAAGVISSPARRPPG